MRSYLLPASWIFGGIVALRNAGFEAGILRSRDAGIPVISIGNLSVGGTGKTPLAEEVARMLIRNGFRTGILSRGYGRETTGFRWVRRGSILDQDAVQCGDEPVQMAINVGEGFVAVDEDRVAGAARMVAEERIDVLVLDDAFQHRWIARTYDIVVMTVGEVLEQDALLPAGRMREPLASLGRADALVLTGCSDDKRCAEARRLLQQMQNIDVFYTSQTLTGLQDLQDGKRFGLRDLSRKRVLAISGIGNPASFAETLRRSGITVAAEQRFPDHHTMTSSDMADLELLCRQEACEAIVMTQKDAVRTDKEEMRRRLGRRPVFHTLMRLEWMGGAGALERAILTRMQRKYPGE